MLSTRKEMAIAAAGAAIVSAPLWADLIELYQPLLDALQLTPLAALVGRSLVLSRVVTAVINLIRQRWPWLEQHKRRAVPWTAVLCGLLASPVATEFNWDDPFGMVLAGLIIGLGAVGAHSAEKNLAQPPALPVPTNPVV